MLFEKKVSSLSQLMKEVGLLDLDSGIRTFGDYRGAKGQFVFVTRSPHDTYVLMVYERKPGSPSVPGARLMVKEFQAKKGLEAYMDKLLSRPVTAFVY